MGEATLFSNLMATGGTVKKGFWMVATVLTVGLLAGGFLMGDDKKPDEAPTKLKGKLPAHFKKLGLSDQQTQQIFKIEANYTDKMDALKKQLADMLKAEHQEYLSVLTDEQKTHLKELLTGDVNSKETPAPVKDQPPAKDKEKIK